MPKLNKSTAKEVDAAQSLGFDPVPDGMYVATLSDVVVKEGPNGTYWTWEFSIPQGQEFGGRKFWNNTSLSEQSRPFLKRMFEAFGVPSDTDTELLYGKLVSLKVSQRIIPVGDRAGEIGNQIDRVMKYDGPSIPGVGNDEDIPF